MKIYLDLLPEEKKEEIKKKKNFMLVIHYELLFSVPILAFFVILLTINFSLKIRAQGMSDSFSSGEYQEEYKELKIYEDNFEKINSKTLSILNIQKNHLNWTSAFYKINKIVPDSIYLSDLATSDYRISLIGKAKTREDLLKFQENIKSEECFSNIEVPLSNLVSKENVEFQVNFDIKENCLKSEI